MSGRLVVISGPMFSGKTEELVRRIRRATYADLGAQVFKPLTDARKGGALVTHDGVDPSEQGVPFALQRIEPDDLFARRVRPNIRFVGLDEAQFFTPVVVQQVMDLVFERKVSVVVAGLARDFRGGPFGSMPQLMALADEVVTLSAVCAVCKAEGATMTYRLGQAGDRLTGPQVFIGGTEEYEPRCRACWWAG